MAIHIDEVLDYLDVHPIGLHEGGMISLMEMLHDVYMEYNTIDSEELHNLFRNLHHILSGLSTDARNTVFDTVCALCAEHEVLAFSHGIVVGMQLMTEVNRLP